MVKKESAYHINSNANITVSILDEIKVKSDISSFFFGTCKTLVKPRAQAYEQHWLEIGCFKMWQNSSEFYQLFFYLQFIFIRSEQKIIFFPKNDTRIH